jgi:hypothetical protein
MTRRVYPTFTSLRHSNPPPLEHWEGLPPERGQLDLPLVCVRCGGSGETAPWDATISRQCGACHGTGELPLHKTYCAPAPPDRGTARGGQAALRPLSGRDGSQPCVCGLPAPRIGDTAVCDTCREEKTS